jgi:hypothetical protein
MRSTPDSWLPPVAPRSWFACTPRPDSARAVGLIDPQATRQFDDRPFHETKWLMVVPMVPPCRYSSVGAPDTNVNNPLSAMKGSAARTRLIWPIPLNLMEFTHCSSVLASRDPMDTPPSGVGHRIEGANPTKDRLQTLGIGNVRVIVTGLAARQRRPRAPSPQYFPVGGTDSYASCDDCVHSALRSPLDGPRSPHAQVSSLSRYSYPQPGRRSARVDTAFATGESADGVRCRNSSV